MDFIEQLFGISPDGGSGFTELVIFLALIIMGAILIRVRRKART